MARKVVLAVGSGECGQLGLGENTFECSQLTQVVGLPPNVVSIASKGLTCAALTDDGELYTWGCNDDGALGRAGEEAAPGRVAVGATGEEPGAGADATPAVNVRHVACGDCHTAAIDSGGALYTWGIYRDGSGQLGYSAASGGSVGGAVAQRGVRAPKSKQVHPARVLLGDGATAAVAVACGANHTAAIDAEGRLFTWGIGEQGQLGRRVVAGRAVAQLAPRHVPLKMQLLRSGMRVLFVVCGSYHTFATAAAPHGSGAIVFAWGLNNHGQLGLGDAINRDSPTVVEALGGVGGGRDNATAPVAMAAGEHHSLALAPDGRVLTFGRGDSGQLGRGRGCISAHTPAAVPNLRARTIASGGNHCFALGRDDGALYTWGFGDSQQLANAAQGALAAGAEIAATFEARLRAFYDKHCPEKADNAPRIAERYAGREEELFVKLHGMYCDGEEPADEWEPHLVTQPSLVAGGRVVCMDGGSQHSVVVWEECERQADSPGNKRE
jgi:regulator of chromosome condensation